MKLHNLPRLRTFRRSLRSNLTPAEAKLWSMIKNSQLEGRKFRRQHSFDPYIVDFYCSSEKLAIELDGAVHYNALIAERDFERDLFMKYFGVLVLRFENKLVLESGSWVLDRIQSWFGWAREREKWIED